MINHESSKQSLPLHMVSAGGVVYRLRDRQVEIVLCGWRDFQKWSLPKGTPEAGESLEQTAIREVQEETGLKVGLLEKIGIVNYWFTRPEDYTRCYKTVHFFLMLATGGDFSQHDPEFDEVSWFPDQECEGNMMHTNEFKIVDRGLELIAKKEKIT